MMSRPTDASSFFYARFAGFAYLLVIAVGLLNAILVDAELIVPGDIAATADNIMTNDLLFRVGIAATLLMYAGVVLLSWALYVVFEPFHKNFALLAMLLRLAEAIVGASTVLLSFVVLLLFDRNTDLATFQTAQLQALAAVFLNVRTAGLDIVLIFVGLGGTLFSYLFFTSKYVPRVLAAWGIFTYTSMLVLSLWSILVPKHPGAVETVLYGLGAVFELVFGFWLLAKGVKLREQK